MERLDERIVKVFRAFAGDDGMVESEGIREYVRFVGIVVSQRKLRSILEGRLGGVAGRMTIDVFRSICNDALEASIKREGLIGVFKSLDTEGNGKILFSDILEVLRSKNSGVSEQSVARLKGREWAFGVDEDGMVRYMNVLDEMCLV